jgi:hypothetical protein
MVIPFADRDPAPAIGHVLRLRAQHLARTQPAIKHQQQDGEIAHRGRADQHGVDLLDGHRPGQPARQPHANRAAHRLLAACRPHERLLPTRDPTQRLVNPPLHRVVGARVLLGGDAHSKKLEVAASIRATVAADSNRPSPVATVKSSRCAGRRLGTRRRYARNSSAIDGPNSLQVMPR